MQSTRRLVLSAGIVLAGGLAPLAGLAASRSELTADGRRALEKLEATEPKARFLARHAHAVLVFPRVLKGGLVFGGQTGDGVLLEGGRATGFYNISGASWGLQIGGQTFGFALFYMTPSSLRYLHESAGFSVGSGPNIVVLNKGKAAELDTTTITQDVYAFPFNQKGLMAELSLQGAKITRIHPD